MFLYTGIIDSQRADTVIGLTIMVLEDFPFQKFGNMPTAIYVICSRKKKWRKDGDLSKMFYQLSYINTTNYNFPTYFFIRTIL